MKIYIFHVISRCDTVNKSYKNLVANYHPNENHAESLAGSFFMRKISCVKFSLRSHNIFYVGLYLI